MFSNLVVSSGSEVEECLRTVKDVDEDRLLGLDQRSPLLVDETHHRLRGKGRG